MGRECPHPRRHARSVQKHEHDGNPGDCGQRHQRGGLPEFVELDDHAGSRWFVIQPNVTDAACYDAVRMLETIDPNTCPRCDITLTGQDFYGPCEQCIAHLRERFSGEQREVVADAYEPKMNVTPNAVALKE